jgi:extracellular factor (EF) 3-hydroxypalmitic acid methyl ester biosynthesis protein
VAAALTATLFRMLRPDGALLLANFTPATRDAAFMEAIMDWHLVYRTPDAVRALAASIPPREIAALEPFSDENGHIAYLRVVKR